MIRTITIVLILSSLLFTACERAGSGAANVVVISQIQQYSTEQDPPTTGAKFYHLKKNDAYQTACLVQIENGVTKELTTHSLGTDPNRDTYLTLSFYPERNDQSWWAWCERSAASQTVFHQGPIDPDWRVANASRSRQKQLKEEQIVIDTIIFCRKDYNLKNAELDQLTDCESIQELAMATEKNSKVRVVALTFDKAQHGGGPRPAAAKESAPKDKAPSKPEF